MTPILYSFRRCPFAMRARLAIASAGIPVEHREVLLRDKPKAMLQASAKGTVPVVVDGAQVIDESYDIMLWALAQNDPDGWRDMPDAGYDLIAQADGPFKDALDRYKYANRTDPDARIGFRDQTIEFLTHLNGLLDNQAFLFGARISLADMAIAPFVRQFAHVDLDWFNAEPWSDLARWLAAFKESDLFLGIMVKHPVWEPDPGKPDAHSSG